MHIIKNALKIKKYKLFQDPDLTDITMMSTILQLPLFFLSECRLSLSFQSFLPLFFL